MLQDLRFALRTLRRNPGFTAASVAVLALGIGASTAVFSVVWAVLLKPLPYPHPEQLVQLWGASPKRGIPFHFMPYADVAAWRAVDAFSHLSAYQPAEMTLTTGGEPERVPLMRVNASFLPMLGAGFAAGRGFTVAEDVPGAPRTAVMGHELWKRRFGGDPGITGRTVELDGHPYRICGVLDAGFLFGNRPAAFYLPLALPARREAASLVPVGAFGRLRSGANPAQAQGGIDALHAADPALRDRTAKVWTLRGFLVRDVRDSLRLLTFAVGLVLLLACANTAALQLARTASRREEFAVRAALGATNVRLLVQVAIECAVPAALGAFAGLGFASALLRIIPALPADRFPLVHRASIDITAAGVALAAAVFATLAGAIVPGLAVRTRPSASRSVTERSAAQNLLIGAEVALAVLLLAAAGVVGRALLRLHQADPGFDSRHVLTASVTLDPPALRTLLHKLSTHPGVESAGATNILPMTIHNTAVWFLPEGRPVPPPAEIPTVWWRTVDAGYLQALRIPLRRGRLPREGEADRVAVVNEALARRFWPGENPVGRRFQMNHPAKDGRTVTVVGVVGNVRHDPSREPEAEAYCLWEQYPSRTLALAVRGRGDAAALPAVLRAALAEVDSRAAVSKVATMDALVAATLAPRRFLALVLGVFALLGLALAASGVYGLTSYTVARRTKEMGVRMALGATRAGLVRHIAAGALSPALAGAATGFAGALAGCRVLRSLLHGAEGANLAVHAAAAALLVGVVGLAALVPALRAAAMQPTAALRD